MEGPQEEQMVVIETKIENKSLFDSIMPFLEHSEQAIVNSLDGNQLIQVIVPVVSIVAPLAAHTVQKLFANDMVTIKVDGIEISAQGYKKAMNLFNDILKKSKEDKELSNEH